MGRQGPSSLVGCGLGRLAKDTAYHLELGIDVVLLCLAHLVRLTDGAGPASLRFLRYTRRFVCAAFGGLADRGRGSWPLCPTLGQL